MKTQSARQNNVTWFILAFSFLLTLLIIAPGSAQAQQWTNSTDPNNINNTNSGNVGIGTSTPASRLEIAKSGGVTLTNTYDANNPLLTIRNTNATNNNYAGIGFANSAASGWLTSAIYGVHETHTTTPSGHLEFFVKNAGSFAEAMRISAAGKVGIGTNSPIYSLDVNGGVNGFRIKGATTSANDAIATFENSSAIQMIVRGDGNVGIGRTDPQNKLHVAGSITVDGNVNAKYQDVAEWVMSTDKLAAGTVVILDASNSNHVVASSHSYDTRVAGVVSSQPGITLGEKTESKVLVATVGRVRVKVDATRAPIQIGDLLVTSDNSGVAMKSEPVNLSSIRLHRPGTLIGKALEPLAKGQGEILVLLSLQ